MGQATFDCEITAKILHQASLEQDDPIYIKLSKMPEAHQKAVEKQGANGSSKDDTASTEQFNSPLYAISDLEHRLCTV
jgi:hypothetical protein